ncbi:MAG TPA: hypothetical protein VN838_28785 [Bradyrhizobium sp.]|nr:hypothetical protein [Bradyrhizobium sp.]
MMSTAAGLRADNEIAGVGLAQRYATYTAVIARLDRATQYTEASRLISNALEYWILRFRGG